MPVTATPSSVSRATLWKVSITASGSEAAQTAAAGPSSSSRSRATTPSATQPSTCAGISSSSTRRERLLGAGEVVGREEQEGEVDRRAAERCAGFARSLAGSFRRLG